MFTETYNSVLSRYFLFIKEKKVTKEKSRTSLRSPQRPRRSATSVKQGVKDFVFFLLRVSAIQASLTALDLASVPCAKFGCHPGGLIGVL